MSDSLQPHEPQHAKASLSITNSRSPPKPMSIESVMPSNHFILCRPLLLLPSIFKVVKQNTKASKCIWLFQLDFLKKFDLHIIALQCCVSFCYATVWIGFVYADVPSFLRLRPAPASHFSRSSQNTGLSNLCYTVGICSTHGGVYVSMMLSLFVPPSPSPSVSLSPFPTSVSLLLHCK